MCFPGNEKEEHIKRGAKTGANKEVDMYIALG